MISRREAVGYIWPPAGEEKRSTVMEKADGRSHPPGCMYGKDRKNKPPTDSVAEIL